MNTDMNQEHIITMPELTEGIKLIKLGKSAENQSNNLENSEPLIEKANCSSADDNRTHSGPLTVSFTLSAIRYGIFTHKFIF